MVECRVLPQLNHDVVLGVDWLAATNPVINWQACTLSVACVGMSKPVVLSGLPTTPTARVELCSVQSLLKDVRSGSAVDAWLMLLQPSDSAANRVLEAQSGAGVNLDGSSE